MKTTFAAFVLAGTAPFLPGETITYLHGEGLIAGDAELNDAGYWVTEYSFGPVGQSAVEESRAAIIGDMLAGKRLSKPVRENICFDGECISRNVHKIDWQSECEVRDTYAYRNMDAVRIEWECDGENDGFNIVDFKNGIPTGVRFFAPNDPIWIKDGEND